MSAPTALNPHGLLPFYESGPDVVLSSTSVAEGSFVVIAAAYDEIEKGDAFPSPFANLKVQRVRSVKGPGFWTLTCEGSGPIGGADAITYGPDTTETATNLDQGVYEIACATRDAVVAGDAFPSPLSGIKVKEVRAKKLAGYYLLTCTGEGLISGTSKIIGARWTKDPHGYDVLSVSRVVATDASLPSWGSVADVSSEIEAGSTMFFLSAQEAYKLDGAWKVREENYQGVKTDKLLDREITVNESIQSPADPITVSLPDGFSTASKAKVSLPRIVVRDTFITFTAPDTTIIPGRATPPNAPSIQSFTITGSLVRNWPYQWKLASITDAQLIYGVTGVTARRVTLTYEFVWAAEYG
jgi:hypothetical protein